MMFDQVEKSGLEIIKGAADSVSAEFNKIEGVVATTANSVRYAWLTLGVSDEEGVEKLLASLVEQAADSGISDLYMGLESTGKLSYGRGWKEPDDYDARIRPCEASHRGPGDPGAPSRSALVGAAARCACGARRPASRRCPASLGRRRHRL